MKSILVLAQPSGIVPSAPPAALASTSEISESPSTTADSEVGQHSLGQVSTAPVNRGGYGESRGSRGRGGRGSARGYRGTSFFMTCAQQGLVLTSLKIQFDYFYYVLSQSVPLLHTSKTIHFSLCKANCETFKSKSILSFRLAVTAITYCLSVLMRQSCS